MDSHKDIFIQGSNGEKHHIGSGYESVEELKKYIQKYFPPNNYTFGYVSYEEVDEFKIEEPTYDGEDLDTQAEDILDDVEKVCEYVDEVRDFYRTSSPTRKYRLEYLGSNVTYTAYDIDFGVNIDINEFEIDGEPIKPNVPIRNSEINVEKKLKSFVESIHEGVEYVGYNSGYASRGMRNPFVTVYGRVHRNTKEDNSIRSTLAIDGVDGILWTDNNNCVPVFTHPDYEYSDEDVVILLSRTIDDATTIEAGDEEWLKNIATEIENQTGLDCVWGGIGIRVSKNHLCIGLSIESNNKIRRWDKIDNTFF